MVKIKLLYLKIGQKNRYWAGFCCKSFKEKSVKKEEFNKICIIWGKNNEPLRIKPVYFKATLCFLSKFIL